jgi:hypothetical protein
MAEVAVTHGSAADIPRLEALWVAVHHQHQASRDERDSVLARLGAA